MRLLTGSNPTRIMASGGQAVNHLDETYAGAVPDIWDHGYVIVDFENGTKAMLELCMFAEGRIFRKKYPLWVRAARSRHSYPDQRGFG